MGRRSVADHQGRAGRPGPRPGLRHPERAEEGREGAGGNPAGQGPEVAGEGGHVAFAPADEQQTALWEFLRQRHGRVTWERVVSGPGLAAIHEYLDGRLETPEAIANRALADPSDIARRSLDLFLAAYGAFAGDMALACLARGGVYLAGGIAAKLLPVIATSPFLAAFNAKAEHAGIAARMPIHVATDGLLGLRGALCLAGDEKRPRG